MKTKTLFASLVVAAVFPVQPQKILAQDLDSLPPVVVKTVPEAGSADVPPGQFEVRVTFSKEMADQSWSWSTAWENSDPKPLGQPHYEADGKTCVMRVQLEPGKTYGWWLNSQKFHGFQDTQHHPAVPYLLSFKVSRNSAAMSDSTADFMPLLNADQRGIVTGTETRFHSFFDARNFDGWSDEDRTALEQKMIDALKGPQSQEYYQAINTLAALHSTNALPALRQIAFDHAEKDNRDRWMATRALGIIGDRQSIPDLIRLLYHYNVNTRWWAQISLVRMTGTNFGKDWNAWGNWWNAQNGQPPYQPEIIRWWNQQPETNKLAESLGRLDSEFLNSQQPQTTQQYLDQQLKLAHAGNYWAKFSLWDAFANGAHGVATNSVEADQWLAELVKGACLAKFEPVNGFNPQTPGEMLDRFSAQCRLFSAKESLGGASFFRTKNQNGKLVGSFLTEWPDKFKSAVAGSSDFKLISVEPLTPETFVVHETSAQESLAESSASRAQTWTNWNNGQDLGSFYAVAGTSNETVAVGIDGRIATRNHQTGAWQVQTFAGDPDFRAIVHAHGQYVVVRERGSIMTSPDGLNWTQRVSPTTENLLGVAWDGHQYLAGGDHGTILASPDGINWTQRRFKSQISIYSFSHSGSLYVAVGNDGLLTSTDSVTWKPAASRWAGAAVPFTASTWTGTEFLACGLGLGQFPTIYTCRDGNSWIPRDVTVTSSLRAAITVNGAIYIAGDSVIKKSTDGGTTWQDTFVNPSHDNKLFMGLAFNGHELIAVGFNHNVWALPISASDR